MAWKGCLTQAEQQFRQQQIQPRYKAQKNNANGWGDNGEVMAFCCFRLFNEVQRLRELAQKNDMNPGPEQDWFEIPAVGPGTPRTGVPAGPSRR